MNDLRLVSFLCIRTLTTSEAVSLVPTTRAGARQPYKPRRVLPQPSPSPGPSAPIARAERPQARAATG